MRKILQVFLFSGSMSAQQSIAVRVIQGDTGKPVTGARVTITAVRNYETRDVQAKPKGDSYVVLLDGDSSIGLGNVTKSDKAWNQYGLCASGVNLNPISKVSTILSKGIESPNDCGQKVFLTPKPGEIIFYVHRVSLFLGWLRNSIAS